MIDALEVVAIIAIGCIISGSWIVSTGVGLMVTGIIMLGVCAYFGSEGGTK